MPCLTHSLLLMFDEEMRDLPDWTCLITAETFTKVRNAGLE